MDMILKMINGILAIYQYIFIRAQRYLIIWRKIMIEKVEVSWNDNYEHDGVMYFAQRITEMLSFYTPDIHRAPLMNTASLISEYIDVKCNGDMHEYHSELIFDEFRSSLSKDVVLQYFLGEEKIKRIINKLNREPHKMQQNMEYLLHLIAPNYLNWSKDYLLYIVPLGKNKKKIEQGIRCLIPELLHHGYSRNEIYHRAKQILCTETDKPLSLLENFLSYYDLKKYSFSVYFAISKELNTCVEIFSRRLKVSFADDGNFGNLDVKEDYIKGCLHNVVAIDATAASMHVYNLLDYYISCHTFFENNTKNLINNATYVLNTDTGEGKKVIANFTRINPHTKRNAINEIDSLTEKFITALLSKASCSMETIQKLIGLHNRALSNNGLENGLLNFWSMLEILCVSDEKKSKINQVTNTILPILKRDYLHTLFDEIYDSLSKIQQMDSLEQLLSQIEDGNSNEEKVGFLILSEKYSSLFTLLTDKLIRYPVLRSRMFDLHNNCKQRKDLYILAEKYGQRVSWHMARIYRARNQIVHSGKTPMLLKDLEEHLHMYVDNITYEVVFKLVIGNFCSISNVLTDSYLIFEEESDFLNQSKDIDSDTIKMLISPRPLW